MTLSNDIHQLIDSRLPLGYGGFFYGVYPSVIIDIVDPEGQGRVEIKLPWSPDGDGEGYIVWARLATFMAGSNRGSWFIPDIGDEVLVVFEGGDPRHPYVIGALWNGQDEPPENMDGAGNNHIKKLRSRNGVQITLDDADGQERLVLETPGGQVVTLKDGPGVIEVKDSNGNSVTMDSGGITVNASAIVEINATQVKVSAGMVNVDAGMSRFSGVVQADSIITNSIISASYTPGAGNIW